MSIEEGSSASGKKRGGKFDYMTMEEARREEASLEEELAEMKSSLKSIESEISKYEREISESNFVSRLLFHSSAQAQLDLELENKKSLRSQIDRAEENLSELQESMSKKARMIQEGMLMPIIDIIVINSTSISSTPVSIYNNIYYICNCGSLSII